MKPEAYKVFAQLCESVLYETSTSIATFKSKKGGMQVAQYLHQTMNLPHDIKYNQINKISWSELKDAANGSWVLLIGDKGAGAIKYDGTYIAAASQGGQVERFSNDRGGNILDFLKGIIGQLRQFYVAFPDTSYRDKVRGRRARDREAERGPAATTEDSLVRKFKPLWAKALTAAIADIKGMAATMIKNDAYEKAQRKLHRLGDLSNALEKIEMGDIDDAPETVQKAVRLSIFMAANHFYPDQTGNIRRSYSGYDIDSQVGVRQLLSDISNGQQEKLSTVLAFFKRNLISG